MQTFDSKIKEWTAFTRQAVDEEKRVRYNGPNIFMPLKGISVRFGRGK